MSETRKKVIKILVILVTGITVLTIAGLIVFPLLWHSFIAYLEKSLNRLYAKWKSGRKNC